MEDGRVGEQGDVLRRIVSIFRERNKTARESNPQNERKERGERKPLSSTGVSILEIRQYST